MIIETGAASTTDTQNVPPLLTALSRCLAALDQSLKDEAATSQQLRCRRFAAALVDTLGRCCVALSEGTLRRLRPVDVVDAASWLSAWYDEAAKRSREAAAKGSLLLDASGQPYDGAGNQLDLVATEYEMRAAAWREVREQRWAVDEATQEAMTDREVNFAVVLWTHTSATLLAQLPTLRDRNQVTTALQLAGVFSSEAALLAQATVSE